MAKRDRTLTYTFRGSSKDLKRLQQLIAKALEVPPIDPQGPVENWGQTGGWVQETSGWSQSGGWYLVVENKETKVSRPDESLNKVTATVYQALSKAQQQR